MDDEDDRHLLDILGDVDALNDYLHGSNSKSIEEDDVTNAAYGSDGSFFASDTTGSNTGLKDGSSSMGEFGEDSAGAGLQLSSSLSFIEDELGPETSPGGVDLGGEDQPFDILQKSLMEADITEQTLAQEALLDSQPAPTLVQAPVPFQSQLVSGGYGGGVGVVTTATAAFPAGQFLQGVSQLPNGSSQHIQVLGSFGAGGGVMTLSSLERSPQIVLRQGAPVAAGGTTTGGQVFAPTQGQVGQVGVPFKNIPLQNIIIQRGPGGTQTLVRPIQPKPLQAAAQTVYSLGLQPAPTTMANVVNANTATPGGQYTANGSIAVQPHLEQQQAQVQAQAQAQTNMPPGQFLLPSSLALTPASTIHNGPADPNSNALITSQNAVQIVAGQNFTAPPGGQLILNQGVVGGSQVGGGVTQTWTGVSCASSAPLQTSCAPGRLTLVGPATAGISGQGQVSAGPVQRLLVTQTQNCTSLSPLPGTVTQEQQDYRQNSSSPALKQDRQVQLSSIHAVTSMTQDSMLNSQKRPALLPLTKGGMILQQLRMDHAGVQTPDRRRFTSIDDALQRLLPYHVFQGAPPSWDEFSQVDEEFEVVATQVLKRTHAMVNKYRRLLMVEAERSSPSSEMVMIDRTFNQEERSNLTQDKRMVLVDPDSFMEDFCCGMKSKLFQDPLPSQPLSSCSWNQSDRGSTEPPYRTDSQHGYGDPGGGGAEGPGAADRLHPPQLENKSVLELKRSQQHYGPSSASNNSLTAANSYPQGNPSPFSATSGGQMHYQVSHHLSSRPTQPQYLPQLTSPPHPETDSALEAAVNSILEC
ncbi:BRD4-interacting chromatin-remodeling complex-associated protein-like [Siniperca chuatsi]|uniref:BRD4-interacting chromatin-remodeling complex-associated protein-like n=1 Tax=Siniperca chuatsi TaxID=119488 RepID=UPI001CE1DB74|nr:BRD4-interacting chromatin-remodeling complex-associated protein-like [Siniperca chuatsi]XP_044033719.1 BRD4-interacting chromatin-remodeling complex-associated protein-like [Siniperca chuatsi]XP_044033720.1 BRD4-interacting chromatin-remodeling complex-associated protein-like [Siniperca chuatsi]XP_044033721.1 BRD4-interacting chromatin-remodeling complex-associated protein-like [Siniperca chuatsi]XP_044033722.1 BRD4-interacting chromatin-remodeling complex-associated protein-like [Siniperca